MKDAQNGFVVGNQYSSTSESVVHLGYYQWVTIAILLQAACFQVRKIQVVKSIFAESAIAILKYSKTEEETLDWSFTDPPTALEVPGGRPSL